MIEKWGDRREERDRGARFAKGASCDACGKPVGRDHCTDSEVCGGGDGPGFYLCSRVRCQKALDGLGVEARRVVYTTTRKRGGP